MSKKIVVLSGSPRKGGNSDLLCDQFLRGVEDAGHEAEKILLRDKTIHHCAACESCQGKGGRGAHAVQPVAALQSEYSLWWRKPEGEGIPTSEELGIGLVPYSPLGKGFHTGKIDASPTFGSDDFRSKLPRFAPEAQKANLEMVELLGRIAEQKGATPAQIALAWLLAKKPWMVAIPGTTRLDRLEKNLGAAAVELSAEDLCAIDGAAERVEIEGERYPEALEALTGR